MYQQKIIFKLVPSFVIELFNIYICVAMTSAINVDNYHMAAPLPYCLLFILPSDVTGNYSIFLHNSLLCALTFSFFMGDNIYYCSMVCNMIPFFNHRRQRKVRRFRESIKCPFMIDYACVVLIKFSYTTMIFCAVYDI